MLPTMHTDIPYIEIIRAGDPLKIAIYSNSRPSPKHISSQLKVESKQQLRLMSVKQQPAPLRLASKQPSNLTPHHLETTEPKTPPPPGGGWRRAPRDLSEASPDSSPRRRRSARNRADRGERRTGRGRESKLLTESVLDEVVEGVAVAVVGELVVAGGELLQALGGDGGEVAGELGVLGQHHGAPRHERVDQRLLPHRLDTTRLGSGSPPPSPPPTDSASRSSPPPPVMRWSSLEGAGGVGVVEKGEEGKGVWEWGAVGGRVERQRRGGRNRIRGGWGHGGPRGGCFLGTWSSAGRSIWASPWLLWPGPCLGRV